MHAHLDITHDASRRAWLPSANDPAGEFPVQNLPFGVFRTDGAAPRGGVAIGDRVVDLAALLEAGLLDGAAAEAAAAACGPGLNPLMALGNGPARALRRALSDMLWEGGGPAAERLRAEADRLLLPMAAVRMVLPAAIGGFSDFFTSLPHVTRSARISRPDAPLPPAFKHLPIAYNSRASSVRIGGEAVRRPNVLRPAVDGAVVFGPSVALDFELELGVFIGPGNALEAPLTMAAARESLFGACLLNDWSARDLQRFESTPLGPFLSKSLSTSVSPWVVTEAALAPFRIPAPRRAEGDPPAPAHLTDATDAAAGGFDIALEAWLMPPGGAASRVSATNVRHLYWTVAQMIAHHASNGCNLLPGDLIGSGTVSGPADEERGCLAEITTAGREPLVLPDGTRRTWLEDGDEVIFRGRCARDGFVPIGFGECRGVVLPALAYPA